MKLRLLSIATIGTGLALMTVATPLVLAQTPTPPVVHLPFTPHIPGNLATGLAVQNTDRDEMASIAVGLHPASPAHRPSTLFGSADPWAAEVFYLPSLQDVAQSGGLGAHVQSDRHVAAIVRTDWPLYGGSTIYRNPLASPHVVVPLVVSQHGNQRSIVAVQNPNTTSDCTISAALYESGSSEPLVEVERKARPGASTFLELGANPDLVAAAPLSFLGSMHVRPVSGCDRIAVQTYVELLPERRAIYAFEGVDLEAASRVLYAPLFRASQSLGSGRYGNTGISVVNTSDRGSDVTVTFYPADKAKDACGEAPITQVKPVEARSSVVFWQGPGGGPVPNGCFGSATISSADDALLLAVVVDSTDDYAGGKYGLTTAAYNAFAADQAGRVVALPLWRMWHTRHLFTTGVSVMNVGAETAEVHFSVTNGPTGQAHPRFTSAWVAPLETYVFWPESIYGPEYPWDNPDTAYGSMLVESSQPVAVIANDSSYARERELQVDASTYSGIRVYDD